MEAVALGSNLVSSASGRIKASVQTFSNTIDRVQSVKWVPARNWRGGSISFSSSNLVGMPLLAGKALPHGHLRTPSNNRQIVVAFMNKNDKLWSERESPVSEKERSLISRLVKATSCALAAGVLIFHPGLSAWAEEMRVTFPASRISELGDGAKNRTSYHAYVVGCMSPPGALHDNGRALLVGAKTYGKGKTQSVTELTDGSALFVTVAKYLSPSLHEIDHVGIAPDLKCNPEDLPSFLEQQGTEPSEIEQEDFTTVEQRSIRRLQTDSCIMVAEHELDTSISS